MDKKVSNDIIPCKNNKYDLGDKKHVWKKGYIKFINSKYGVIKNLCVDELNVNNLNGLNTGPTGP